MTGVASAAGDEAGVGRDFEGCAAVVAGDGGELHGGFSGHGSIIPGEPRGGGEKVTR